MPYITQKDRKRFNKIIKELVKNIPENAGELNYILTKIVIEYISNSKKTLNYQTYNDAIGALECCKLELYRRKISEYEETKIIDNGDVYNLWAKLNSK